MRLKAAGNLQDYIRTEICSGYEQQRNCKDFEYNSKDDIDAFLMTSLSVDLEHDVIWNSDGYFLNYGLFCASVSCKG